MRSFLQKGILFVVMFVLVNLVLGVGLTRLMQKTTKLALAEKDVAQCMEGVTTVFFGDSHVQSGVNPGMLPSSFNFSSGGETYLHTYYKLRAFLEGHPDVDTIVLPFDRHSFSSYRTVREPRSMWYWRSYMDAFEVTKVTGDRRYLKSAVLSYVPQFEDPLVVAQFLSGVPQVEKNVELFCGFTTDDKVADTQKLRDHASIRAPSHFEEYELMNAMLIGYFERTVELARSRGVRVLLVSYPVSQEYRHVMSFFASAKELKEYRQSFLQDHPDILYFDAAKMFDGVSGAYRNSDHLNVYGAAKLTELMAQVLGVAELPTGEGERKEYNGE